MFVTFDRLRYRLKPLVPLNHLPLIVYSLWLGNESYFLSVTLYSSLYCLLFTLFTCQPVELSTVMIHRVLVFSTAVNIVVNLFYDSIVGQKLSFMRGIFSVRFVRVFQTLWFYDIRWVFIFNLPNSFLYGRRTKDKITCPFCDTQISMKLFVHDTFDNTLRP